MKRGSLFLQVWIVCVLFLALAAGAATRSWDGSASSFWTNAANWSGSLSPLNGDLLVFPAGPARLSTTNTSGGATNFTAISITGSNYVLVSPPLSLTNGLTNASAINTTNTVRANLAPRADQAWVVNGRNTLILESNVTIGAVTVTANILGVLQCEGTISGGANSAIEKTGGGRMEINGSVSVVNLDVQDGTIEVNGQLAATLNIANGATLAGSGNLPQFSCFGTVSPGSSGPGRLTASGAGSTSLGAGSLFLVNLDGLTPATQYDQLRVSGALTLGGGALALTVGFTPAAGDTFVIVTNTGAGAISGTFNGLPEGAMVSSGPYKFRISYVGGNGNDVTLTALTTGQARVWSGASTNSFWSNPLNWVGNIAPAAGDSLVFPSSVTNLALRFTENNFSNLTFNQLAFGGSNGAWTIEGQGLRLVGGIVATNGGFTRFQCDFVELASALTFQAVNMGIIVSGELRLNGQTLTVTPGTNGTVTLFGSNVGPGTINMNGSGSLSLRGNGGPGMAVNIQNGTTVARASYSNTSPWQLTGGVLELQHADLPTVQATGGRLRAGLGGGENRVQGNLSLSPVCVLEAAFDLELAHGPALNVSGTVNLNGAAFAGGAFNPALIGTTVMVISNETGLAINGTFAGLPEGAVFASTNLDGLVFSNRISYVGGDGNDVTLTVLTPGPTGVTRDWTGNGGSPAWSTPANWLGNALPNTGDGVRFPVLASRYTNDNDLSVVLNGITWLGSNYAQFGSVTLLGGMTALNASGTNFVMGDVFLVGNQTWAISNVSATLRLEDTNGINVLGRSLLLFSLGALAKTGPGTLEIIRLPLFISGGVTIQEGTLRMVGSKTSEAEVDFTLLNGRFEAAGVNTRAVAATGGELLLTVTGTAGGMAADSMTLGSNATFHATWNDTEFKSPEALVIRDSIHLGGAHLAASLPVGLTNGLQRRLVRYDAAAALTGTFAGLPEGAVTNLDGYRVEIHYAETNADDAQKYVTLTVLSVVAPQFTQIQRFASGDVILRGLAKPGTIVMFEATEDFVTWTPLGSAVSAPSGIFTFADSPGVLAQRFYRAAQ